MKYYTTEDKKLIKSKQVELTSLDRAILEKCRASSGMNVIRVIKAGKPYRTTLGERKSATTEDILSSVSKLQKLKLLIRR